MKRWNKRYEAAADKFMFPAEYSGGGNDNINDNNDNNDNNVPHSISLPLCAKKSLSQNCLNAATWASK